MAQTIQIKEALKQGLRRFNYNEKNSKQLYELTRCVPTPFGVREPFSLADPFAVSPYDAFPFPQLIKGKGITLLAGDTSVAEVTEATPNWTSLEFSTFDAYDATTEKVITSGGVWHFADMYGTWILCNGSCLVFRRNDGGMLGQQNYVRVHDTVSINSVAYHKGRCFFGGFDPDNYWSDEWRVIFDYLMEQMPFAMDYSDAPGQNFVLWSSIGGGDVFNLLFPKEAIGGHIAEAEEGIDLEKLIEGWQKNEAGTMPMNSRGEVLKLHPLRDSMAVYSSDGLCLLPSSGHLLGRVDVASIGTVQRGAVCGGEDFHFFITPEYELWMLENGGKLEKLGYKEYLSLMEDETILMTWYPDEQCAFICSDNHNFQLTPSGLGGTYQKVTGVSGSYGVFVEDFEVVGEGEEEEEVLLTEAILATDVIDCGVKGDKEISIIEVACDGKSGATFYVAVDYRYDSHTAFTRSAWVICNDNGIATFTVVAPEFRICVKCTDYEDMKIDHITVEFSICGRIGTLARTAIEI